MFRQSPGRSQRSKGIKVKHVLQLCFLIAICFWLIYQVKHSHDKKKEFDESDAKVSMRTQDSNEMIPKFGRKDLKPKVDEIATTTKKQNEEAEEEEESVGEEEENKHEEAQQEEEQKFNDKEDEGKGVGEDELPEHEQEKLDPEVDREEETIEEEKDKEEGDEKESEENDPEDDNGQLENENSLDDHDDEDGTAKGTHEAREELYKADDASSAVTHETQIAADETENEGSKSSNEHPEMDKSANENQVNNTEKPNIDGNTSYSKTQEREMIENNHPLDTISNNAVDNVESKSENSFLVVQSDDHAPLVKNTTEVIREADSSSIQNSTETIGNLSHSENVAVDVKAPGDDGSDMQHISLDQSDKSTLSSGNHEEDPKPQTSNPDNGTLPIMSEKSMNSSIVREDNSQSSTTGSNNTTESKNLDPDDGTSSKENDAVKTENPEVQNDPIDSSDSSVAVRTDLETLPAIQAEATNDEDAAAE